MRIVVSILLIIGLVGLYFANQKIVKIYQKPGRMGIIESQTMDMTVQPPQSALPVVVETVKQETFSATVTYSGAAVAYNDIAIYPRVDGWIVALSAYPGDRITKGQVLAQLDTKELNARALEAKSRQTKANYAINTNKANLDYWKNKIQRSKTLAQDEVITQEEYEQDLAQFEAIQSEFRQSISEQHAAAASAAIEDIRLAYATITAPIDGVITERTVAEGALVMPGNQIFKMAQLKPIRIQANVAESDLSKIRVGNQVKIFNQKDKSTPPIESQVSAIFPVANLQTRTAIVEAVIPNDDERFIVGDYIVMEIETERRDNVLTVSNDALIAMNQQTALWIVKDNNAHLQYVTAGSQNGDRVEIATGLDNGAKVIIRGKENLQEGMAVAESLNDENGLQTLAKADTENRLTAQNGYSYQKSLEHYSVEAKLAEPPKMGDNTIHVQASSLHGSASHRLTIEVEYLMPAMPTMINPKPEFKKLKDGQFDVKLIFTMPGLWQINLFMKKEGKELGKIDLQVDVPQ